MSLGPKSNFIPVVFAGTKKKKYNKKNNKKTKRRKPKLRADTAIEKSMMSADVKLTSDAMKARDVNVLKGPKR